MASCTTLVLNFEGFHIYPPVFCIFLMCQIPPWSLYAKCPPGNDIEFYSCQGSRWNVIKSITIDQWFWRSDAVIFDLQAILLSLLLENKFTDFWEFSSLRDNCMQEICVGILGNMACNSEACRQISDNKQLVSVLFLIYYVWLKFVVLIPCIVPSVLWRCWLGSRKVIWPVKNWVV